MTLFIVSVLLLLLTCFSLLIKKSRNSTQIPLPPGPKGLPIVGNLPFLDPLLHIHFTHLSKTYGPIFKLQLGTKLCIVISSPATAKQVLKDHDAIFANRDVPAVVSASGYGTMGSAWSPYGENWRMVRKVYHMKLFSSVKLDDLYELRRREVRDMVKGIYSKIGNPVDIGEYISDTMLGLVTSMLWGYSVEKDDRVRLNVEIRQIVDEVFKLLGRPNVSDLFPALAVFDIQGVERKLRKKILPWLDRIFDFVFYQKPKNESKNKDFLQVLLELNDHQDHNLPFNAIHIKALFLDMLVAGTKSSSTTIEWAIAELMKHPEKMRKVKEELDQIVGIKNIVEESHLSKLKYLNAVIKETLRLHPVGPLLVPRSPSESRKIGNYMVPKGAQVLVNAYAIQRDPEVWQNPLVFTPERFLNPGTDCSFSGTNLNYIPFGSGRRVCVGLPLAERTLPYFLATVLHSFNWKLPEGMHLDFSETFVVEVKKKIPLVVIPTARLPDYTLYA